MLALVVLHRPRPAAASSPDWQGPLTPGPISRLFVAAGSLIVQTSDAARETLDGGQTWRPVALPAASLDQPFASGRSAGFGLVGTDPSDESIVFANGSEPLYRSTDGGATWDVVLTNAQLDELKQDSVAAREPDQPGFGFHTLAVAISPSDPTRVYAEVAWRGAFAPYGLYASTDGGHTWVQRQKVTYSYLCTVDVLLLQVDPSDPHRVFDDTGCFAGRDFGSWLPQSRDDGRTFTPFWSGPGLPPVGICQGTESSYGFPRALVGGGADTPARWLLAVNRDYRFGGSTLLRSDDDGTSWQSVLAFRGGGSADCTETGELNVQIAGLAADDTRLYVARNASRPGTFPRPETIVTSGVMVSTDDGATWNDLGSQQLGHMTDLALGPDRRWLFAATDQGLLRLELSDLNECSSLGPDG